MSSALHLGVTISGILHPRILAEYAQLNQQAEWNWPHSWVFGSSPHKFMETANALRLLHPLLTFYNQRISFISTTKWQELKNWCVIAPDQTGSVRNLTVNFPWSVKGPHETLLHCFTCCHKELRVCKKQQLNFSSFFDFPYLLSASPILFLDIIKGYSLLQT